MEQHSVAAAPPEKYTRLVRLLGLGAALVILLFFWLSNPIAQDPAYHQFADQRTWLGVPNAWNVLGNLPFVLVGILGLVLLARLRADVSVPSGYRVLFAGVLLTGFGSGWYHLDPHNASLFWDRLPMTIAFMGFFSALLAELVNRRLGERLLLPLVLVGAGTVVYWLLTERAGAGDLRPYALVQFLPMLIMPVLLAVCPRPPHYAPYVLALLGFYVLAKLTEHYDTQILALLGVSGHALKHILAAVGVACLLPMLYRRYGARASRTT